MGIVEWVVVAIWAMLPAYVPNNAAILAGGGRPIDGGRTLGGRRLLGDGKTWRGTAAGILAGAGLALALTAVAATGWFAETFALPVLAVVVVLTPLLHVGTNVAAYALSLKSEPW